MAKQSFKSQNTDEGKRYPFTFYLPSGVSLTSVSGQHVPPSGDALALTPTTTYVDLPTDLAKGRHLVNLVAVTNSENVSPKIRIVVDVPI